MLNIDWAMLGVATWQTIYMVGIASIVSISLGGLLGIVLFWLSHRGTTNKFYTMCSLVVNIFRSIPFIILLICLIPLTRLIVGSSIGSTAAIVPLTIAAIPFYARIMETALNDVSPGLLKAADAMGMTKQQIMLKVMLPESLAVLVKGATLLIISLIGFSAMAGAVGGGGLGGVAINYGYQQFNIYVMLQTVVILVLLVQAVQWLGNYLAEYARLAKLGFGAVVLFLILLIGQFSSVSFASRSHRQLNVGIVAGLQQQVMRVAAKVAAQRYHLQLHIKVFDDFMEPNRALAEGSLDANIFQHVPFLNVQVKKYGYPLVPVAKTFVYPFGFYSRKIHSIKQLRAGDVVALPADPSNLGRALLLLNKYHVIRLKHGTGLLATVRDIVANPHGLKFRLADSAMIPRILPDIAMGGVNNSFIGGTGLTTKQAVLLEGADSPYGNVIVIRKGTNSPLIQDLVKAMHSKPVVAEVNKVYPKGAAIPAW